MQLVQNTTDGDIALSSPSVVQSTIELQTADLKVFMFHINYIQ